MTASCELTTAITALLAPNQAREQEFLSAGTTIGEVYAMAAWLRANLPTGKNAAPVCLAADDRAIVAAALLASLAGGPVLLMPYAFSPQALAGLHKTTGATMAISDTTRDLPPGMEIITPGRDDSGPPLDHFDSDPEKELLRLYTGGSTGMPQIWSKTGINIFAESLFLATHFGVGANDRIIATISPYHIYGLLYSVTLPLVSGATVVPGTPSYPEEIIREAKEYGATILISVPAHYRALHGKVFADASLRLAFSSAGALDPHDNSAFCQTNEVDIMEVYGSTETGGIALRNRRQGEGHFTPYPTLDWKIEGGQLLVRSPYLSFDLPRDARGYFTTGDRVEPFGSRGFSLKGRADSITKVGGNRVDLEEIAEFIKGQPGVTDCLVLSIAENGGRQQRIAAVIEGVAVSLEELKKALAGRFEPYALPRTFKTVQQMPIKDNGKYDRQTILGYFEK